MANVVEGNFAAALKTLYEKRLLVRAAPRLIHGRWGQKAILNGFNIKEWRRYAGLAAVTSALTEATTPAEGTQPTVTQITATPAWYGSYLIYSDELSVTSYDPVVGWMSDVLGEQAGLSVDTLRRNVITDGATKDFSGNQAARAALDSPDHDITYLDFLMAVTQLQAGNARPIANGRFIVIMHPHTYATLMNDTTFVNLFTEEGSVGMNDGNPLRSGYMGHLLGCEIYVTSNARIYTNGGVGNDEVYSLLFIGQDSYGCVGLGEFAPGEVDQAGPEEYTMTGRAGKSASPVNLIIKGLGEEGSADPLNQRGSAGWKAAEQTVILNSAFILDMEHTTIFSA
jgi:N4-gp56 family major capsid protein